MMVRAWIPARAADSTWLRMSASSGEMITVGPEPQPAQQGGGHKIHSRFAPAGPLDHQRTATLLHQGGHRLPLVLPQPRRSPGAPTRLSENGIGFGTENQVVHTPMQPDGSDNQRIHPAWRTGYGGCARSVPGPSARQVGAPGMFPLVFTVRPGRESVVVAGLRRDMAHIDPHSGQSGQLLVAACRYASENWRVSPHGPPAVRKGCAAVRPPPDPARTVGVNAKGGS